MFVQLFWLRRVASLTCAVIFVGIFVPEVLAQRKKFKVTYPDGKTEEFVYDKKDCRLIGWQKKVGFDLSLKKIQDYRVVFGFSTQWIRELDDLQKDFGLQYEALCMDFQMGVYRGREQVYECRRNNVSKALILLRSLKLSLEPVKEAKMAENVKANVSDIVEQVLTLVPNSFSASCVGQHLVIGRDNLVFAAEESEKFLPVRNVGVYSIKWWPKINIVGVYLDPSSGGALGTGSDTKLIVIRGVMNAGGSKEGVLVIQDDLKEEAQCHIKLLSAEAQIKESLELLKNKTGNEAIEAARAQSARLAPSASVPIQNLLAGEMLIVNGNATEAWTVLSQLRETSPIVSQYPEFQLALGASAFKIGKKDIAFRAFKSAGNSEYATLAAGYAGWALSAEGRPKEAQPYLNTFRSNPSVSKDSWIRQTLNKIFDVLIP